MKRIAKFYRVSEHIFGREGYEHIRLPERATSGSAGYDFFAPYDFTLEAGCEIVISTGVRVRMDSDWVLVLLPRSGQGFKYGVRLANTAGVIDSDYFGAENEGHIRIKLVNANSEGKTLVVRRGEAFAQGVLLPFGVTEDDDAVTVRTGGFGSTDPA